MATNGNNIITLVSEVKDVVAKLETRLQVHDQKHIEIDSQRSEITITLKDHGKRIGDIESLSKQNQRDLAAIVSVLNKLVWAFVTPFIAVVVGAVVYAISLMQQVAK